MPGSVDLDKDGHISDHQESATQLTAGAVGVVTAGTVSGTTAAGAAPTTAVTDCTDVRGNFTLTPVTGGGAQAAGVTATVRFAKEYGDAPGGVQVTVVNETDQTAVAAGATLITAAGFGVMTTILTPAKVYRVHYTVVP